MVHPDTFLKAIVYDDVKSGNVKDDVKPVDVEDDVKLVDAEVDAKPIVAHADVREQLRTRQEFVERKHMR